MPKFYLGLGQTGPMRILHAVEWHPPIGIDSLKHAGSMAPQTNRLFKGVNMTICLAEQLDAKSPSILGTTLESRQRDGPHDLSPDSPPTLGADAQT